MGYADFDGERLFDLREQQLIKQHDLPLDFKSPLCLPSDSRNRLDLIEILNSNWDEA